MDDAILKVKDLKKHFKTSSGVLHAVDGVSFDIKKGHTLGIVGESGCGKSTLGRVILRLLDPTDGQIIFEDKDITRLKGHSLRKLRSEMQMIFQDPFSSIDPKKTVFQAIREPIAANRIINGKEKIDSRIYELMDMVGLARRLANVYPHELDGGRRQRIGIARAMAMNPQFIVCDEPVSALDVSIQAQVLNLLKDLQTDHGLTYVFITHDLAVVHCFSDEIAVMYLGKIVEKASAENLFQNPMHPYTKALLSAIPVPEFGHRKQRILLKGEIASPINPPEECRFAKRCDLAVDKCRESSPNLIEVRAGHQVACHLVSVE